jgi:hypothetical protein
LRGLGRTENKTLTFDQVVERYNKGITFDEIQAWVWYKRRQGVPMTGWNRYYIEEKGKQYDREMNPARTGRRTVLHGRRAAPVSGLHLREYVRSYAAA